MHHNKVESIMESKVEDAFLERNLLRKEADNSSSVNSGTTDIYNGRACVIAEHAAGEESNFYTESCSHDIFSENADSKTSVRIPDTCDVSKDVDMTTKVLSDESIFEDKSQPKSFTADNMNTQCMLLSRMISDSLPQKTLIAAKEKDVSRSHGDNISCIYRSTSVNIAGSPDNGLGGKDILCGSIRTSDLPCRDHKNLKFQTAYGENDDIVTNSRSSGDHANESPKKCFYSGSANGAFPGRPDPSHFSCQIKEPPFCDTNSRELEENPCFQTTRNPSEKSLKQGSSRLADEEMKYSSSISEISTDTANDSHKTAREGVVADGGNTYDQAIKFDIMKQEKQNIVTDSKLGEPSMEKSKSSLNNFKGTQKSVKGGVNSSNQQNKSDMLKEEHRNPFTEPNLLVDDVKVCDICGDAGREDLLAVCSKCSDGAEHTYCMRIMLDKLPEVDWLCEGCKFKEDAESKKVVKPVAVSGMSREPSFNKSCQGFGNNSKDQPKLDNKTSTGKQPVKGLQNLQAVSRRYVDSFDIAAPPNNRASEIKCPNAIPSGIGSPILKKVLPHDCSSSLDAVKVRPSKVSLLSADSSQAQNHALTSSEHNSSSIQAQNHSALSSLSKSHFDNVKAKIKLVTEHITQKTKTFNEPTRIDIEKEVNHMMGKSVSFKGMEQSSSGIDSTSKPQIEYTRSLSQGKEKSETERRNTFSTIDHPHSSSSLPSVCSISSKDTKAALHDGKLNDPPGTSIVVANKETEDTHCSVMADEKQQQISYSENHCTPNGEFAEYQKPQSWQSAGRDVKNKPISLGNSRQGASSGGKLLKCQKCNETGHATQFCSIDKIRAMALKPSGDRNQVSKTNRWKDAANVAVSKVRPHVCNRLSDQPSRLPSPSTNISSNISVKVQLDISGCLENLTPSEGTTDTEESSRRFTNNSNKSTVQNNFKQKAPLPREPAHASKNGDPIIHSDSLKSELLSEILPEKASLHCTLLRASAFPETCHIWLGSFEVYRSGNFCNLHNGVQAHLSNCASPKVLEVVTSFPCKVQLEEASCINSWPLQFHERSPTEENIALFFFATDIASYEKSYKKLVDDMMKDDLVLKGGVEGVELFIFSSNKLPKRAQCWNGFNYLWGVLRAKKDCSERVPDCEKKQCGFSSDAKCTGQYFPSRSADTSASEKEGSGQLVIDESSTCRMQVKINECERLPTTSMDAERMSCGRKSWNFDLNEHSHDDKRLEEVVSDNGFTSKKQRSCTSVESASISMAKENSVPGNCCDLAEVGATQHQGEVKKELAYVEMSAGSGENTTLLAQLLTGEGKCADAFRAPTAVPQTVPSARVTATEKKTKTSNMVIDLEAVPGDFPRESIVHAEHIRCDPMHDVKKASSYSPETASQASGEVLARESTPWKGKIYRSDQNKEPKRFKLCPGEHSSDNEFFEHEGSERRIFPVGWAEPIIPSSIISSSDTNSGSSSSDAPNFKLASRGEREKRSQKMSPLFSLSLPGTDNTRPPDSVPRRDDPTSLRLSLAVPSPENVPLSWRTEELENASSSTRMEQHLRRDPI